MLLAGTQKWLDITQFQAMNAFIGLVWPTLQYTVRDKGRLTPLKQYCTNSTVCMQLQPCLIRLSALAMHPDTAYETCASKIAPDRPFGKDATRTVGSMRGWLVYTALSIRFGHSVDF